MYTLPEFLMKLAVATTSLWRTKEGLAHPEEPARLKCEKHEEGECERIAQNNKRKDEQYGI